MSTDRPHPPNRVLRLQSSSPEGTESVGLVLGENLHKDQGVIGLEGTLGAGKTALTRGIVEGVTPGEGDFVSSPTYAVCNIYPTEPPIYHYDLYRLTSEDDLESVGFYDSLGRGVLLVEWPQKIQSVLERSDLRISLRTLGDRCREIAFQATTPRGQQILDALAVEMQAATPPDVSIIDVKIEG